MLGDAQLAEDAAQEAFLEAYLNLANVKLLLEYGADVHIQDELGRTALDWAMIRGQAEVVELLRQHNVYKPNT